MSGLEAFLIGIGISAANAAAGAVVRYGFTQATAQKNAFVLQKSCYENEEGWKQDLVPRMDDSTLLGKVTSVDLSQRIKMLIMQYFVVKVIQNEGLSRRLVISCVGDTSLKFKRNDEMGLEFGNYMYRELLVDAGAIYHMHKKVAGRFSLNSWIAQRGKVRLIPSVSAYVLEMLLIRTLKHIAMVLYALSMEWTKNATVHIMGDEQFQYLYDRTVLWETTQKVKKDIDIKKQQEEPEATPEFDPTAAPIRRLPRFEYLNPTGADDAQIEEAAHDDICYGYGEMIKQHSKRVETWIANCTARTAIQISNEKRDIQNAALWKWHREFIEIADGVKGGGKLRSALPFFTKKACKLALVLSGTVYYEMNPTLQANRSYLREELATHLPCLVDNVIVSWGDRWQQQQG